MKIKINPVENYPSKKLDGKESISKNKPKLNLNKKPVTWRIRQKFNLQHQGCPVDPEGCVFTKLLQNLKNIRDNYPKSTEDSDSVCSCTTGDTDSICSCYTDLKNNLQKLHQKLPLLKRHVDNHSLDEKTLQALSNNKLATSKDSVTEKFETRRSSLKVGKNSNNDNKSVTFLPTSESVKDESSSTLFYIHKKPKKPKKKKDKTEKDIPKPHIRSRDSIGVTKARLLKELQRKDSKHTQTLNQKDTKTVYTQKSKEINKYGHKKTGNCKCPEPHTSISFLKKKDKPSSKKTKTSSGKKAKSNLESKHLEIETLFSKSCDCTNSPCVQPKIKTSSLFLAPKKSYSAKFSAEKTGLNKNLLRGSSDICSVNFPKSSESFNSSSGDNLCIWKHKLKGGLKKSRKENSKDNLEKRKNHVKNKRSDLYNPKLVVSRNPKRSYEDCPKSESPKTYSKPIPDSHSRASSGGVSPKRLREGSPISIPKKYSNYTGESSSLGLNIRGVIPKRSQEFLKNKTGSNRYPKTSSICRANTVGESSKISQEKSSLKYYSKPTQDSSSCRANSRGEIAKRSREDCLKKLIAKPEPIVLCSANKRSPKRSQEDLNYPKTCLKLFEANKSSTAYPNTSSSSYKTTEDIETYSKNCSATPRTSHGDCPKKYPREAEKYRSNKYNLSPKRSKSACAKTRKLDSQSFPKTDEKDICSASLRIPKKLSCPNPEEKTTCRARRHSVEPKNSVEKYIDDIISSKKKAKEKSVEDICRSNRSSAKVLQGNFSKAFSKSSTKCNSQQKEEGISSKRQSREDSLKFCPQPSCSKSGKSVPCSRSVTPKRSQEVYPKPRPSSCPKPEENISKAQIAGYFSKICSKSNQNNQKGTSQQKYDQYFQKGSKTTIGCETNSCINKHKLNPRKCKDKCYPKNKSTEDFIRNEEKRDSQNKSDGLRSPKKSKEKVYSKSSSKYKNTDSRKSNEHLYSRGNSKVRIYKENNREKISSPKISRERICTTSASKSKDCELSDIPCYSGKSKERVCVKDKSKTNFNKNQIEFDKIPKDNNRTEAQKKTGKEKVSNFTQTIETHKPSRKIRSQLKICTKLCKKSKDSSKSLDRTQKPEVIINPNKQSEDFESHTYLHNSRRAQRLLKRCSQSVCDFGEKLSKTYWENPEQNNINIPSKKSTPNTSFQRIKFKDDCVENHRKKIPSTTKLPNRCWESKKNTCLENSSSKKVSKQCSANFDTTDTDSLDNLENLHRSQSLLTTRRSWERFKNRKKISGCNIGKPWKEILNEKICNPINCEYKYKLDKFVNSYKTPTANSVFTNRPSVHFTDSFSESNILKRNYSRGSSVERSCSQPLLSTRIKILLHKYEDNYSRRTELVQCGSDYFFLTEDMKRYIYPSWSPPEPGPGLLRYQKRLDNFVCQNNPPVCACPELENESKSCSTQTKKQLRSNSRRDYCNCDENDKKKVCFSEAFDKPIYPVHRPQSHRMSFVDDPPYCNMSNFLSDVNYTKMKLLYKERNGNSISSDPTYKKVNNSEHYCRHNLPRWINKEPED